MSTQQVLDHDLDAGGHSIMTSLGSVVTIDTGKITIQNGNAFPITVGEGEYDDALTWISTAGWELGSVVYLMAQGPIPVAPSVSTPPAGFGAILLPNGVTSLTLAASETAQFVLTGAGWLYVSAPRSVAGVPTQVKVLSGTSFDKTNSTDLDNIPFLDIEVEAGETYQFNASLFCVSADSPNNGGFKVAIAGSATATVYLVQFKYFQIYADPYVSPTPLFGKSGYQLSIGDAYAFGGVIGTAGEVQITGAITVATSGSLVLRFAQNVSNGAASSVMVGSSFSAICTSTP
jgi:hypothetical protein